MLSCQSVTGGSATSNHVKFKEQPNIYLFIFDVSPTRIIVKDNGNNVLDEVKRDDPSVGLGKIGFRGEISLTVEPR